MAHDLDSLQREVDALRLSAKLLAEDDDQIVSLNPEPPSQPQMIRAVLREAGTPLHILAITNAVNQKFKKKFKAAYLTAVVYRHIKAEKLFAKVEGTANTFTLREFPLTMVSLSPTASSAPTPKLTNGAPIPRELR